MVTLLCPGAFPEYLAQALCYVQILCLCIGKTEPVSGRLWSRQALVQIPTPSLDYVALGKMLGSSEPLLTHL